MNEFNYELLSLFCLLVFLVSLSNLSFFWGGLLLLIGGLMHMSLVGDSSWHSEIWAFDHWRQFVKGLLLFSSLGVWYLTDRKEINTFLLLFFTILASLTLISCDHLLMIYLSLELQTFCLFILISKNRGSMLSTEAGLKYFILGAISSGIFLLGVCLHYGMNLGFNLTDFVWTGDSLFSDVINGLILIALFFKLTVVPFHFWAPDVYEGASTETVVLIATLPKISVLTVVVQLGLVSHLLVLASAASMVLGTLGALNQTKIKRLMAYSGISHVGFMLMGVLLANSHGIQATYVYMMIYVLMVILTFTIVLHSPLKKLLIVEFSGLHKENPTLALSWTVILLSIAGIPPLAGFISKWLVLWAAFNFKFYLLSLIAIICSMMAGGYYLRIVKMIYFQKRSNALIWESILSPTRSISSSSSYLISLGTYGLLFMMLNPTPWVLISHWGTLYLY
uniref:NADH:ubiquinone reductase (H(+)-translocating) n=1 Tax=Craspedacusta sowerbii TaxID=128124 RepID=A0A0S4M3P7_CRASO|nr:NADH dehydrogenase subunit 2 [Craspedacusta sowerbii]CUS58530.1 TPA: NADH dehydrogenase subunit 2 [Craspedacusta sowerbii]